MQTSIEAFAFRYQELGPYRTSLTRGILYHLATRKDCRTVNIHGDELSVLHRSTKCYRDLPCHAWLCQSHSLSYKLISLPSFKQPTYYIMAPLADLLAHNDRSCYSAFIPLMYSCFQRMCITHKPKKCISIINFQIFLSWGNQFR